MYVDFEIKETNGKPLYPNGIKEFKVLVSNLSKLDVSTASFSVAIKNARTEIPHKLHLHYKSTNPDTGVVTDEELDLTEGIDGFPHSKSWNHNLTDTELSDLRNGSVDILFEIQTSKGVGDTITTSDFSNNKFPEPFIIFIMPNYDAALTSIETRVVSGPEVKLKPLPPSPS